MSNNKNTAFNRFDKIVILTCSSYPERIASVKERFASIGITDYEIYIDTPSPMKDVLYRDLTLSPYMRENRGAFNCTFAHHEIMQQVYESNLNNILIAEDDIAFHKDISFINTTVSSLPEDYDLALFDHTLAKHDTTAIDLINHLKNPSPKYAVNNEWTRPSFLVDSFRSSGLYAISRKGIETFQAHFNPTSNITLHQIDHYFQVKYYPHHSHNFYISRIPPCIQSTHPDTKSITDYEEYLSLYRIRNKITPITNYNVSIPPHL
jgi:GR25 family glycosyltransferase involved in LPS biosynthesis